MRKCNYKNLIMYLTILTAVLFIQAGCQYAGVGSLLGTPGYEEETVPAEYDITKQVDNSILVLVEQPTWLSSQANLRFYLTRAIRQDLMVRAKFKPEKLVAYDKVVEFRSSHPDFSSMTPVEVGRAMDANMVLLILVENYQLNAMADTGYLAGNLDTRAVLYNVKTGERLWPKDGGSKSIKVGFEIETKGPEVGVARLAAASAFCTTRYLYDCQKALFRIAEDRTTVGWESWK